MDARLPSVACPYCDRAPCRCDRRAGLPLQQDPAAARADRDPETWTPWWGALAANA